MYTFLLTNLPLIVFDILSYNFFMNEASQLNSIYQGMIVIEVLLIPIINVFFMLAASSDPGIIPARSWTGCK